MSSFKEYGSTIIGTWGILYSIVPNTPKDWLLCMSTVLVIFQLIHWIYRFYRWLRSDKEN